MKYLVVISIMALMIWDLGAFSPEEPTRLTRSISRTRSTSLARTLPAACSFLHPTSRNTLKHEVNRYVRDAAAKYGVDEDLVYSMIFVESSCRVGALSPQGAVGLMQVLPTTAQQMGYSPHTTQGNIYAGTKYLSYLQDRFNGQVPLMLAAYNAGPEAVKNARGIPNYRETRLYVDKVLRSYRQLRRAA